MRKGNREQGTDPPVAPAICRPFAPARAGTQNAKCKTQNCGVFKLPFENVEKEKRRREARATASASAFSAESPVGSRGKSRTAAPEATSHAFGGCALASQCQKRGVFACRGRRPRRPARFDEASGIRGRGMRIPRCARNDPPVGAVIDRPPYPAPTREQGTGNRPARSGEHCSPRRPPHRRGIRDQATDKPPLLAGEGDRP